MIETPKSGRLTRRSVVAAGLAGAGLAASGSLTSAAAYFSQPSRTRPGSLPPAIRNASFQVRLGGGVVDLSSATLFDVDGDGKQEIFVGTTRRRYTPDGKLVFDQTGMVCVLRPDGSLFQNIDMRDGGSLFGPVNGSVSLGRLFANSNTVYLVIPVGGDAADVKHPGGVKCYRFNGSTGRFEYFWERACLDDLPDGTGDGFSDPVVAAPLLADFDGDGDLEIFYGGWDQLFYLLRANGDLYPTWRDPIQPLKPGWVNGDTIWSSASGADVDGDGKLEIICGSDIYNGTDDSKRGGYVTCFKLDGSTLYRNFYDQSIYSSPAVADIDGDGQLEVVVGTSNYYQYNDGRLRGNYVLCLNARTGQEKWRFLTNGYGWASPAVANVLGKTNPSTGKPTMQVTVGSWLDNGDPFTNDSRMYLIDSDGKQVWSTRPRDALGKTMYFTASPIIVDYNGDGKLEIIQAMLWDLVVLDAATGQQIDSLHTEWSLFSSAVVGDADGDGLIELYVAGGKTLFDSQRRAYCDRGYLYAYKLGVSSASAQPWPMFRRNPSRNGVVLPSSSVAVNVALNMSRGAKAPAAIDIQSASVGCSTGYDIVQSGGTYRAFASNAPVLATAANWLSVQKIGTNVGSAPTNVARVSIDPSQLTQNGVHSASFTIRSSNACAQLTVDRVNVVVTVADYRLYAPRS